jgi:RNA methyltransferase, TrmH family
VTRGQGASILTSPTNPRVKLARALRQRKQRDETGLFVAEGIHPVGEAVASGAAVEFLCCSPGMLQSQFARELVKGQAERGVPCLPVSADVFASIADKENPQGLLAVLRQRWTPLADLSPDAFNWGVALVAPQDPGNIGTILRTLDSVGASGLILLDGGADPHHPSAVRASMGALFWHPVARASFAEFTAWAGQQGFHLYGTSAHGAVDYRAVARYERPMVLVLGSEQKGLSAEQAGACERVVRLPMQGRASSLNLAVAAGVMLYAMLEAVP